VELTRGVDPDMLAALAGPFYPVTLVYLDWPAAAVRAHSGKGEIELDGETFLGTGAFGAITIPAEGMTFAASGAVIGLIGAPADVYDYEDVAIRNRAAKIWAGVTTTPGGNVLIGEPCLVFAGVMDGLTFTETLANYQLQIGVAVSLATGPGARENASVTHSYEDQIIKHPGDTAGKSLIDLVNRMKAMTWPE
jgi:hypothetical protein